MLHVFLHNEKCGSLERDGSRYGFKFSYEPGWKPGAGRCRLSMSMPRDASDEWAYDQCRGFFRGLLPEGRRRELLSGRADPNDDYALLEKAGDECAGAVTVTAGDIADLGDPSTLPVTEAALMDALRRNMPLKVEGGRGVRRFSLAGVQPKETLYFDQGEDPETAPLRKAGGSLLSTHIIKPGLSADFPGLAWNELFCMRLAESLKISVPPSCVREVEGVPCLVIARLDRAFQDGRPYQIHQEDLCQALGALEKYEYADGAEKLGPGFAEMPAILRSMKVPAMEKPKIRHWAVFNLLAGNADAHGKNLSMIHRMGGGVELAPFYDLVCTARYPEITTDLAMAFGKERNPNALLMEDFELWAIDLDVKWQVAHKTIKEVCVSMADAAEIVRAEKIPQAGRAVATGIIREIRRRVQMVSDVFGFGFDAQSEPAERALGWRLPS